MANECCAHSIVKHTKVHVGGGVTKDAWACCDCGMRFDPAPHLPTFAPEPSHLHLKLDKLRAEIADKTQMATTIATDMLLMAIDRDRLSAEVERLKNLVPPDHERSQGGVGQGTWYTFAASVVEERERLRAEVTALKLAVSKMAVQVRELHDAIVPARRRER